MYRIVHKKTLAKDIVQMDIEASLIARRAMPGQFVMLRVTNDGERIPLTLADFDPIKGVVSIIFQTIGATTSLLAELEVGQYIHDFVGPLGKPTSFGDVQSVLCIGGGVGTAVVFPQVKALFEKKISVDVIVGARNRDLVILENEMRQYSNHLYIMTDDGSYGEKGFVTQKLQQLIENENEYDLIIAIGPLPMMKAVAEYTWLYEIPTIVSMNPIMVDGTGMCGSCRVTVAGKTVYACVDGPDFDGHQVDFEEAINRQRMYKEEEKELKNTHICRVNQDAK